MQDKVHINDLNFEHNNWKQELEFQKDELKIFQNRLDEIVVRWSNKDVLGRIEQYQNIVIRQNEVVDTLLHEIKVHNQSLGSFAEDHPVAIDHLLFNDHTGMRDKMDRQRTIYGDFKKAFFRFLTESM